MTMDNALPAEGSTQTVSSDAAPAPGPAPVPVTPPAPAAAPEGDPTEALQAQLQRERARRSGLDTLVDTRVASLETTVQNMESAMTQMMERMEGMFSGQPSGDATPAEDTPAGEGEDPDPVVLTEAQELDFMTQVRETRQGYQNAMAALGKERMLLEVSQQPEMQGLGLLQFAENIPTHTDPQQQLEAIQAFAAKLQGQMGTTTQRVEQAFAQGATAGSSPGQGPGPDQASRAREVWATLNDPIQAADLSEEQFNALNTEFNAFPMHIQAEATSGVSQPWPNISTVMDTLQRRMDSIEQALQGQGSLFGPGG